MKAQGQLEHVLEEAGQHGLAALMGKPVGEQSDEHATHDHEQAKADPGGGMSGTTGAARSSARAWSCAAGQRIDDAPEQHRLGEQRDRQRHIGDGEQPAKTDLRPEQTENPPIEAKSCHGSFCAGPLGWATA